MEREKESEILFLFRFFIFFFQDFRNIRFLEQIERLDSYWLCSL